MTCTNCHHPRTLTNPRPYITAWIYQYYFEFSCGSTLAVTLVEAPEEDNLVRDGELYAVGNGLSDLREAS